MKVQKIQKPKSKIGSRSKNSRNIPKSLFLFPTIFSPIDGKNFSRSKKVEIQKAKIFLKKIKEDEKYMCGERSEQYYGV